MLRNLVYSILRQIHAEHHSSMIVIPHDLSLTRNLCDDIRVLYMGRTIEQGPMECPSHPYIAGLIQSLPNCGMVPISPPDPTQQRHSGCPFYPRCAEATERCGRKQPSEIPLVVGGKVRCLLYA